MIGVASRGPQQRYSLVRKVLEKAGADATTCYDGSWPPIRDLLKPTRLYPGLFKACWRRRHHGMVTSPEEAFWRIFSLSPDHLGVTIRPGQPATTRLFDRLQQAGDISNAISGTPSTGSATAL